MYRVPFRKDRPRRIAVVLVSCVNRPRSPRTPDVLSDHLVGMLNREARRGLMHLHRGPDQAGRH
jgi:hypothetical protein